METQKTMENQNNLGKEIKAGGSSSLTLDYNTKLQLSRHYGTGTKTKIQINGTG